MDKQGNSTVTRAFKPRAWEVKVEGRVSLFFTNESLAEKYFSIQKRDYPDLERQLIPLWTGNELLTDAEQQHLKDALTMYHRVATNDTYDNRVLGPLNNRYSSITKKLLTIT